MWWIWRKRRISWKDVLKLGKSEQISEIKDRLEFFVQKLDEVNPEHFELSEIDQLLSILDDLEKKCGEILK